MIVVVMVVVMSVEGEASPDIQEATGQARSTNKPQHFTQRKRQDGRLIQTASSYTWVDNMTYTTLRLSGNTPSITALPNTVLLYYLSQYFHIYLFG